MRSACLAVFCVALLSSQAFGQLGAFFPRNGMIDFNASGSNLAMVVADSDEGLLVSPLSVFESNVSIMTPVDGGIYGTPLLRSLTEAPHQLDNGDYAVAIGLVRFNPAVPTFFELESFLQLRLAGSSATALTGVAGTPNNIGDPYTFLDDTIVSLGRSRQRGDGPRPLVEPHGLHRVLAVGRVRASAHLVPLWAAGLGRLGVSRAGGRSVVDLRNGWLGPSGAPARVIPANPLPFQRLRAIHLNGRRR